MVIWIIGPSGAGKTTIGRLLTLHLRSRGRPVVHLDGDVFRSMVGAEDNKDYSIAGRYRNAILLQRMCDFLDKQNIDVVCTTLCIFEEILLSNREIFSSYLDIELQAELNCLRRRDVKGLYRLADLGKMQNFVGYDIAYPKNLPTFLKFRTDASNAPNEIFEMILRHVDDTN